MFKTSICKYNLKFRFDAGTSRGILKNRDTWFITICDLNNGICGIGECAPIHGLSPDDFQVFDTLLENQAYNLQKHLEAKSPVEEMVGLIPDQFPSIKMGAETALLDLRNGGKRKIFINDFSEGKGSIPVNGLIWMGPKEYMLKQIREKIDEGYNCIKIKVGAIRFEEELDLIKYLRNQFKKEDMTIRLDANGAYSPERAKTLLERLSEYEIHSIEQPVRPEFKDMLAELCANAPVPVALDESLIGVNGSVSKRKLLEEIHPAYIVLKPTLLGGFYQTEEWITLASNNKVGWWVTSALESNIGLNAISQFTAGKSLQMPQGLGTGQLYSNNIPSPLKVKGGRLGIDQQLHWDFSKFPSLLIQDNQSMEGC